MMPWLRRHYAVPVIALVFALFAAGNWLWLGMDTLLPHDDLGYHLVAALKIADYSAGWTGMILHGLGENVIGFYPPLFHVAMALFVRLFGRSEIAAIMANAPFMLLLLISCYFTGKAMGGRKIGLLAGTIALLYPYVFDAARLALPDFALTAMVAASFCTLVYTGDFSRRWHSVLFGITLGLGMLTKQVFIFFVAVPFMASFIWGLALRPLRGRTILNAELALVTGLAVCGYWYLPRLAALVQAYVQAGYHWGSMHPVLSGDSLWFYASVLYRVQLLPSLTIAFLSALLFWLRQGGDSRFKLLLLAGFCGSYIAFTLIANKHAKTTIPMLPYAALITAAGLLSLRSRALKAAVISLAVLIGAVQYVVLGFPVTGCAAQRAVWCGSGPSNSIFRMGGRYRPLAGDCRFEDMVSLIGGAAPRMPAQVGVYVFSMDTEAQRERISSFAASRWAVDYYLTKRGLPHEIADLDPGRPTPAEMVAVVPDTLRDDFLIRVPGIKTRAGTLRMPDDSAVDIFTVKRKQ